MVNQDKNLSEFLPLEELGIVGCGGAGFPTHVKLAVKDIDALIVNGAECEPLLHKDKELLLHQIDYFIRGLQRALSLTNAKRCFIGIKEKYEHIIKHVESHTKSLTNVQILKLGDFYPAGDEYELVYEATQKLIPFGGIPLHIGCVVINVETLIQIGRNKPMTKKALTIAGNVNTPITIELPIGTPIRQALYYAGVTDLNNFSVIDGGPMMGRLIKDYELDNEVVTKTCGGLIVLPKDHPQIIRMKKTDKENFRIGKAACDQCSDCTELCPRYLLGYPIKPHKAMRTAQLNQFIDSNSLHISHESIFCCECGLCSLYSCPEGLPPREITVMAKRQLLSKGIKQADFKGVPTVHPLRFARRVNIEKLIKKLALVDYNKKAPYTTLDVKVEKVKIPLKMHIGVAAEPIVKVNERVTMGQKIAKIPEGKLGAVIHASISGKITDITDSYIVICKE